MPEHQARAPGRAPDHTTIARFRVRHEQALTQLFTQILGLCAKAGLVSLGVVALDATALSGDSSPEAIRSYASIRQEVDRMLGEAAAVDAAEDELFGQARGDELPDGLRDRRSRLERLKRCQEELETERAREVTAYEANLQWRAEWEAEDGRKLAGLQAVCFRSRRAGAGHDQHHRPRFTIDPPGRTAPGSGLQRPGGRDDRTDHRRG